MLHGLWLGIPVPPDDPIPVSRVPVFTMQHTSQPVQQQAALLISSTDIRWGHAHTCCCRTPDRTTHPHSALILTSCSQRACRAHLCSLQVTSDGVPVIWHDDSVVQQSQTHEGCGSGAGDASATTTSSVAVADMPLQRFKEVVEIAAAGGSGGQQPPPSSLSRLQLVRQFRGVQSRAVDPGGLLPW